MRATEPVAGSLAATALALTLVQGCCCPCFVPIDGRDDGTSLVVLVIDTLVPIALALAWYRRQERAHRADWVRQSIVTLGHGAYREGAPLTTAAEAPRAVRVAACIGFVSAASSIPALLWAAGPLLRVSPTRLAGILPLATVLGLSACAALAANALLACKPLGPSIRLAGLVLVLGNCALLGLAVVDWTHFTSDLAARLNRPAATMAVFAPDALTIAAAAVLVAWPAFGLTTAVALLRAASALPAPEAKTHS